MKQIIVKGYLKDVHSLKFVPKLWQAVREVRLRISIFFPLLNFFHQKKIFFGGVNMSLHWDPNMDQACEIYLFYVF